MPWFVNRSGKRRYVPPAPIGVTVAQTHRGAFTTTSEGRVRSTKKVPIDNFVPPNPVLSRQQRRLFLRQLSAGITYA